MRPENDSVRIGVRSHGTSRLYRWAVFAGVALALASAVPAGVQAEAPAQARTSINCRSMPLRTALRTLVQNAGLRHQVRFEVPDIPVTLELRDVPFEDALKALLRQASFSGNQLRSSFTADGITVRHGAKLSARETEDWPELLPPGEPTPAFLKKQPTAANHVTLRESLKPLFTAADAPYVVDENIPDVRIALPDAPPATLWGDLQRIVGEARRSIPGLYVGRIGEIYVLAITPTLPPVAIEPPLPRDGSYNQRKISIRLVDVPFRSAIDTIFAGTGYQYSINPDVPNFPITMELRNIGLQHALRMLVREGEKHGVSLTFSKG